MKRKLPASIKGTPVITKFFKRSVETKTKTSKELFATPKKAKLNKDGESKVVSGNCLTKECKENIGPGVVKESEKERSSNYFKKTTKIVHQETGYIEHNHDKDAVITTNDNVLVNPVYKRKPVRDELTSKSILSVGLIRLPVNKISAQKKKVSSLQKKGRTKDRKVVSANKKNNFKRIDSYSTKNSVQAEKDLSGLIPKEILREDRNLRSGNNKENLELVHSSTVENNFQIKDLRGLTPKERLREGENLTSANEKENLELVSSSTEENNFQEKKDLPGLTPKESLREGENLTSANEKENLELVHSSTEENNFQKKDLPSLTPKESIREDQNLTPANEKENLKLVNSSTEENNFQKKDLPSLTPKESLREGQNLTPANEKENLKLVNSSTEENNFQKKDLPSLTQKESLREDQNLTPASEKENLELVNSSTEENNFQREKHLSSLVPKEIQQEDHNLTSGNNKENLELVNLFSEKDTSTSLPKESIGQEKKATSNCVENSESNFFTEMMEKDLSFSLPNESVRDGDRRTSNCKENQEPVHFIPTDRNSHSTLDSTERHGDQFCVNQETKCKSISACTSRNVNIENFNEMEISESCESAVEDCNKQNPISDYAITEGKNPDTLNAESESDHVEMTEDDEDESDDELLSPPAFLCQDYRLKPEINTPEKCETPLTGSPLTPISPFVQRKDDPVQCRYSLAKLVLEKPKQVKKDKEMVRLQSAIHEQIEKGRMARLAEDTGDSEDDDETILPIHQKELDKFTSKDKEFTEEIPGENVFPEFNTLKHDNGCSQPFPTLDTTELDTFTKSLFSRCDVEIRELLCGGWITQRYLVRPCPQTVVQWLFHILSYHLDTHTIQASYNALWSIMNAKSTKEPACISWMPSVHDLLRVLHNHGAIFTSLLPKICEEMDISSSFDQEICSNTEQGTELGYFQFPLVNLTRVIQFMTSCMAKSPGQYNHKDIEVLVVSVCCLSLDLHMDMCQHDIKTCLEATYNALEESTWRDEAMKLSSMISQIGTHHRNRLHLALIQPYSCRGRDVRRLISIQTLAYLDAYHMSGDDVKDIITKDMDDKEDKEITDTLKLFETLEKILHQVRIRDDTDYYQLYTIIELLDLVVGAESLLPREKVILERITGQLRLLNRDIKDPRAMFISRTKVKDLILRTISKFVFMAQGKKEVQRTISTFFEDGKYDLYIEALKSDESVDIEATSGATSERSNLSPDSDISVQTDDTAESGEDLI